MKKFLVRACNLVIIIAALLVYNKIAQARVAEDVAAKAEADAANAEVAAAWAALEEAEEEEAAGAYIDGTYQGTATGFGGDVTVEVVIEGGYIESLSVVSAEKEDGAYLEMAMDIVDAIIKAQSAEVDTITGATFSSTGIKDAAAAALAQAQ